MMTLHFLRYVPFQLARAAADQPAHPVACRAVAIMGAVLLLAAGATGAQAHAHIEHAVPAVASVVQKAPDTVEITFNEVVEPAFSTIEILDGQGGRVEIGKVRPALDDAKTLRIGAKLPRPGVYLVVWRVLSVDTHRSTGNFKFTWAP